MRWFFFFLFPFCWLEDAGGGKSLCIVRVYAKVSAHVGKSRIFGVDEPDFFSFFQTN